MFFLYYIDVQVNILAIDIFINQLLSLFLFFIIDYNMDVDNELESLKERFFNAVDNRLQRTSNDLENYRQRIRNLSPETILKKGFALIMMDNKIVCDPRLIPLGATTQTLLKNEIIHSKVTEKTTNGTDNVI